MTLHQRAAPVAAWKIQASSPVSNVVDFARYAGQTRQASPGRLAKILARAYGAVVGCLFLGTLLYAIGFVGGTFVPKNIDTASGGWPATVALCIDLQLLAFVAVQLSGTARRGFRCVLAAHLSPAAERSTYLLCASLALILLFAAWQPLPILVWQVSNPKLAGAVDGVALLGWLTALTGMFLVSRFERSGSRPVAHHFADRTVPAASLATPGRYHFLHPIHPGFIVAFWAAPTMTAGHLLFAAVATFYVFVRIWLE